MTVRATTVQILICLFFVQSNLALAEDQTERYAYRKDPRLSNCTFYRSKKADIPIYEQPDTSARIIGRLGLGEEICYIGERQGFAIADWSKQHVIRAAHETSGSAEAFVRLVDLWGPRLRPGSKDTLLDRARAVYEMRRSGVVPEDPFGPLRPIIEEAKPEPKPEMAK